MNCCGHNKNMSVPDWLLYLFNYLFVYSEKIQIRKTKMYTFL